MKTLFDRTVINGMELRNRFVRSATWEGMCDADGRPSEKLINCYRELARGGVGLIISGYTFVRPDGKQLPGKMGIHTDDFASDMMALTKAVHDENGKVCMQLVHAGGQASSRSAGRQPLAPSAEKVDQFPEIPREMSLKDIAEITAAFGKAAGMAKAFGFDAVQIHGAHGYLVNQFLSPLTNCRTDKYGGSIENRSRFVLEVYNIIRKEVGDNYPVTIKLNASDNLDGGLVIDDAVYTAKKLAEAGIDAIEVSAGTSASGDRGPVRTKINMPEKEAYNLSEAVKIKNAAGCPVMAVGGFRSYNVSEDALINHGIDYISMSRPLIREPHLVQRWRKGDRSPAKCISCNSCFKPGLKEGGIYCVVEKKERERKKE